jgi:hypothetical protein
VVFLTSFSYFLESYEEQVLFAIYVLLEHNPKLGRFFKKLKYKDLTCMKSKYYLIEIQSILLGLSAFEKESFLKSAFSSAELRLVLSRFGIF